MSSEFSSERLIKKVVFLLNDIVQTGGSIFPESKDFIAKSLAHKAEFVQALIDHLVLASSKIEKTWDVRENIL